MILLEEDIGMGLDVINELKELFLDEFTAKQRKIMFVLFVTALIVFLPLMDLMIKTVLFIWTMVK